MRTTCCLYILILVNLTTLIHVTGTDHFNDYVEILSLPVNVNFKLRVVKSLWCQLRTDYIADLNKTTLLYRKVLELISSDQDHQSLYELQQQMRRYVIVKAAESLANVFNSRKNYEDILNTHTFLVSNYELEMLKFIYAKAIDEIQLFEGPAKLASHIRHIYHKGNMNEKSLALTLYVQLHLFDKLRERNAFSDTYRFNVAYYFHQIQHDNNYGRLDGQLRTLLTTAAKQLPKTLQYLFLEESFCLSNNKSQYLYTGYEDVNIDEQRRYVFLWTEPNTVGSQGALIADITELPSEVHGELKLHFALKSKDFNIYWYLEPSVQNYRDIIAAWRPGNKPARSDWTVQLLNDELIFEQNGYIMCNSGNHNNRDQDNKRVYLNAYKDDAHSAQTSFCRWAIGYCPP